MRYHTAAFLAGFVLDLILGDPHWLWHPVRLIGWLVERLEKAFYKRTRPLVRGAALVAVTLGIVTGVSGAFLGLMHAVHPLAKMAAEAVMTWRILAVKSLKIESMRVYRQLKSGNLPGARKAAAMIVGRDTKALDEEGVIRAAVETVAENTTDGVIAPMLYLAAGGPALGFFYKAVNTMDSMLGYRNDRYLYFGRAAARLDDAMNFLPARISAWLMIAAARIGGREFDAGEAWRIYRRDRKNHASPNSAQTEAVCAGALGVRLAGDASYFGKTVKKPWIGDARRPVEAEDIRRANKLLYLTAFLGEGICLAALAFLSFCKR